MLSEQLRSDATSFLVNSPLDKTQQGKFWEFMNASFKEGENSAVAQSMEESKKQFESLLKGGTKE